MQRVRMFGDWDDSSRDMIEKLKHQTDSFDGDVYNDVLFVDDDSYTHAMVFNYPVHDLRTPAEKNVALLLEPPEISDWMHAPHRGRYFDNVSKIYSFAYDPPYPSAYGIGFATAPKMEYPKIADKPKRMCMIASDKLMTPYHGKRHDIKSILMKSDIDIDFYGRNMVPDGYRIKGTIPPMEKYKVLAEYQFCIDFENSGRNVVTDKFFDPVLCNTIPITNSAIVPGYWGVVVDFNRDSEFIAQQIEKVFHHDEVDFYNLDGAKKSVMSGTMCLAKWVTERVKER